MKKILFIFAAILLLNLPAFSEMTPEDAISETYIHNHGYSDEMARLINLQNCQVNGVTSQFKSKEPAWYTSDKRVKFIRNVFTYLDPGEDDGQFLKQDYHPGQNWSDL